MDQEIIGTTNSSQFPLNENNDDIDQKKNGYWNRAWNNLVNWMLVRDLH